MIAAGYADGNDANGGRQLRLFNARHDEYGFQPIHIFDGSGRLVTSVLRPAASPLVLNRIPRNLRRLSDTDQAALFAIKARKSRPTPARAWSLVNKTGMNKTG